MLLKTERLGIRYIVEGDWRPIREIWEDFALSEFAQYDMPHNTEGDDVRERIARWAKSNANGGMEHMFFAVCLAEDVIGYIAFNVREKGYEVGYCFHSAFHGKGYAKESHLALFEYLRGLGIRNFTAGTAMNNKPSVALLKALGFQQVGTERVSFYKDAEGKDIVFEGGIFELTTDAEACCCHHKTTPRSEQELKLLKNRLNRIIGQLNGIGKMLDDNRYCGEILTQLAAAESALQSFGYVVLKEHMETCVVEEISRGNTAVVDEAVELIKKLK